MDLGTLRRIAARAVQNGATIHSPRRIEWNIAGRCEAPTTRELFARREPTPLNKDPQSDVMSVTLHTRCRKCAPCRAYRKERWRSRIGAEISSAPRSWFVTLTFDPTTHLEAELRVRNYTDHEGRTWFSLSDDERFALYEARLYRHLQLYLKRLRKKWSWHHGEWVHVQPKKRLQGPRRKRKLRRGNAFRYVVVSEMHSERLEGFAHYHLLMHETDWIRPVKYKWLDKMWPWIADASLVKEPERPRAHWYVTKYLTKQCPSKIRASFAYGRGLRSHNVANPEVSVMKYDTPASNNGSPMHLPTLCSLCANGETRPGPPGPVVGRGRMVSCVCETL